MNWIALAGAVALAGEAAAQDAPPPGCRWQDGGATLACKDGKGYWRRSGDGEIVGRYAVAKPKPKPAPKPVAQASPAAPAAPQPAPAAEAAPPPEAAIAAEQAAQPAPALAPAPEAPPPPAAAPPAEPWWKRALSSIWNGIIAFLHLVGLLR